MAISEYLKNRILSESDIVDVIGGFVDLKKRGSNFVGLCPFHNEKTPSFSVSADKGIYKCFGCGKAGNAAGFLMEYAGMTFPEALKELARKSGIPWEEETLTPQKKEELTKRDLVLECLGKAAGYYSKLLQTTAGKTVLNYFRKRGFSDGIIKDFQLGCSPDSWDEIKSRFGKDYSEDILLEAGLLVKNEEKDSVYDRFRNRAMFPIHNNLGKVIAFGARALSSDETAKYINSPQSIVYDKSSSLYGFFQAKNEIRSKGSALLTEGYADVISLHQAGFKTAVASSGTSLTKEQLAQLKRICKSLYFVYDSDSAGINAAKRGLEMALEQGFDVNIVLLPKGEDPDSIIQKNGEKFFRAYLDDSLPFLDFFYKINKDEGILDQPQGKAEAIRTAVRLISKISDRLQHDFYLSKVKDLFGLTNAQLKEIYREKSILEKKNAQRLKISPKPLKTKEPEEKEVKMDAQSAAPALFIYPEEEYIFEIIISCPGSFEVLKDKYYLSKDIFTSEKARDIFLILDEMHENGMDLARDIFSSDELSPEDKEFLSKYAVGRESPSELWKKFDEFQDDLVKTDESMYKYVLLKPVLRNIERKIRKIQEELKDIPFEMQAQLLTELKKLSAKKEAVKNIFMELKSM